MEEEDNKNGKVWDRAWTTEEIRRNSSNWTLAGDIGLYNLLNEFSQNIISRTHEIENSVDSLVYKTKIASVKINNVINDFHMLSNLQFVENRVYDEEVTDTRPKENVTTEKTKEQKEAELLPKIIKAVELGLSVLDQAFDKINVGEMSDSEDEEDLSSEGRTILEPKDPYDHRPLPFIIGSEEFQNSDFAGLQDMVEETVDASVEDGSITESEESSSDEEEPLPFDTTSTTRKQNERKAVERMSSSASSSDESDLFGSEKQENGYVSDHSHESKAKEVSPPKPTEIMEDSMHGKEKRLDSVASIQSKLNLPQVLPVPKKQGKGKVKDDLFFNDEHSSDDDSPFRKKTGLFATDTKFDDDEDTGLFKDDLFSKQPGATTKSEDIKTNKAEKAPISRAPKEQSLFDDDDSEDDIFSTLSNIKKAKSEQKSSIVSSQESVEKAESSSTPSSAPSTKPSGSAFDLIGRNASSDSLFGEDSDVDDLFAGTKTQKKFDFETAEDDDLFGLMSNSSAKEKPNMDETPQKEETKTEKKTISLFEDSGSFDDVITKTNEVKSKSEKPPKQKAAPSLFEESDDDNAFISIASKTVQPQKEKKPVSLFEDSDIFGEFSQKDIKETSKNEKPDSLFDESNVSNKSTKNDAKSEKTQFKNELSAVLKKKEVSNSIFDDYDDDDIFTQVKTEKNKEAPVIESKDSQPSTNISEKSPAKESDSLFSAAGSKNTSPLASKPAEEKKQPLKKVESLFEDSDDNSDLFFTKETITHEHKAPIKEPVKESRSSFVESGDKIDGSVSSVSVGSPSFEAPVSPTKPEIGFDVPVDVSKTLNVLSKDRVKVTAKRRKPTRKGRLAALQTSDTDNQDIKGTGDSSSSPIIETKSPTDAPKMTHKQKEKQKKDIMSQLMSEVATSKVGRKSLTVEEEVVDAGKKDEKVSAQDTEDTENDGFFAEPSFEGFRSSISAKDPILDMDEDDDDLFKSASTLPKVKTNVQKDTNDIFGDDDDDIFAGIQKEKYEMFPSQLYEDDDDIFGNMDDATGKGESAVPKATVKKETEKKQVNIFDDPLTGLLDD